VVELDGDLRLVDEALDELLVGAQVGQDLLDDDQLLEALNREMKLASADRCGRIFLITASFSNPARPCLARKISPMPPRDRRLRRR
jgi:hypothetical protein